MDLGFGPGLMIVEGSILASVVVMILFLQREMRRISSKPGRAVTKKNFPVDWEKANKLLRESEALSQNLSQNLEEKRVIVQTLINTLEEKIQGLGKILEKVESQNLSARADLPNQDPNGPVLEMAHSGVSVPEISKRLGLSKEEVQLILDLKKIPIH